MKQLSVSILFFIHAAIIFAQLTVIEQVANDKIDYFMKKVNGLFWKGEIALHHSFVVDNIKVNDKQLLVRSSHSNGKIAKEYARFDDSTFFFTEYYEQVDTSKNAYPDGKRRHGFVKRHGLVRLGEVLTNDTIVTFDPETLEECIYFNSVLEPTGEWRYYAPNGALLVKGFFENGQKQNNWQVFKTIDLGMSLVQQSTVFERDKMVQDSIVDVLTKQQANSTTTFLQQGFWKCPTPLDSTTLAHLFFTNTIHNKTHQGTHYSFEKNHTLLVSTIDAELPRHHPTKKGTWKLTHHNILEMQLAGSKKSYEIQYLSNELLVLKPIK